MSGVTQLGAKPPCRPGGEGVHVSLAPTQWTDSGHGHVPHPPCIPGINWRQRGAVPLQDPD